MTSEPTTSVRLPNGLKEELIKRFGSLRGAIIAMYELQKMIDKKVSRNNCD